MIRGFLAAILIAVPAAALCAFSMPSPAAPRATPGPDVSIFSNGFGSPAPTAIHQTTTIEAWWQDVDADDAGAVAFEWSIEPGLQDWVNVGLATSASTGTLSMTNGMNVTVLVRAIYGDGSRGAAGSASVLVDLFGPRPGIVSEGPDAWSDIDLQASASSITASWTDFNDPEIGPEKFEWAIGTSPGGTDVQDFTDVGGVGSATRDGLSLSPGTRYYVTVRGIDYGGLTGDPATSDGIEIDVDGPLAGTVADGSAADIDLQGSTTTVRANWQGFSDAPAGVATYEWSIGTAPGAQDVMAFEPAGASLSAMRDGLMLTGGTRYYVTVRATDAVGNVGPAVSSDGVVIEAVGPSAGVVKDGPDVDLDLQSSSATLRANWSGFGVSGGAIAGYKWAIGTTPGGTTVQAYVDVGSATSALRNGLALADGTYYVSVYAYTAGGGAGPAVSSDGVTIDSAGPTGGLVKDGAGADIAFQKNLTTIEANWSGFADPGFGVGRYEWAIGVFGGDTSIAGWTDAGLATSMSKAGLSLVHGTRYHVSVRPYDAAGNAGPIVATDGVMIDAVAPVGGVVNDGATGGIDLDAQTRNDWYEGSWSGFSDPGMGASGIAAYYFSIGTTPGGSDLGSGWGQADLLRAVQAGLSLLDGAKVYLTVKAADAAGNVSAPVTSDGLAIDRSGPAGGAVNDGPGGDVDAFTGDRIDANWSGFSDAGSGIVSYEWCVGTTPGGGDMQAWTNVGPATSASIAGPLFLPNFVSYYVSVRAKDGLGNVGGVATSDGAQVQLPEGPKRTQLPGCGNSAPGAGLLVPAWLALLAVLCPRSQVPGRLPS